MRLCVAVCGGYVEVVCGCVWLSVSGCVWWLGGAECGGCVWWLCVAECGGYGGCVWWLCGGCVWLCVVAEAQIPDTDHLYEPRIAEACLPENDKGKMFTHQCAECRCDQLHLIGRMFEDGTKHMLRLECANPSCDCHWDVP